MEDILWDPEQRGDCTLTGTRDHLLMERAFRAMNREARAFLWFWLNVAERYPRDEVPERDTRTGEEFLWHELLQRGHSAGGVFWVVNAPQGVDMEPVFLSPDLAGARLFADHIYLHRELRDVDSGHPRGPKATYEHDPISLAEIA